MVLVNFQNGHGNAKQTNNLRKEMYDKPIIAVKPKKKYIHVNMHKIRANKKHGTNEAVITVKEGRKNTYGHEVEIHGPSKIVYGGNDKPLLPCGARVVIETEAEVTIK